LISRKAAFLVVGGDSLVGDATVCALKKRGYKVYASTRRRDTVGDDRVYIDFEDASSHRVPDDVGFVFIIAAATDYGRCETDPMAQKINEDLIPALVRCLLSQDVFVSFISTNSVFGGDIPWPGEGAPHAPTIAYARQKSEGERRILAVADAADARDRINITRLTKIMSVETTPFPGWVDSWEKGGIIEPFEDFLFAPMSVDFVGAALATLGEARVSGNTHLSGADNVSYVAFAQALAHELGVSQDKISPTTSEEKGVNILYKPRFSGIGMARTTALTGLEPQPLDSVVADLARTWARSNKESI